MNILFFLTPKSDVDFINEDASLLKTLQKMQERNYQAIPIVGKTGRYIGTIHAGDILGCIKENFNLSLADASDFPLKNVRRVRDNKAVNANCHIEDIFEKIVIQNFIPVVDDDENFIGIITRGDVIKFVYNSYLKGAENSPLDKYE
ncbi:MAG: CBS domain-containing protein [Lachnospiraceae bacterium]|jgi:CBS domain-containing protein